MGTEKERDVEVERSDVVGSKGGREKEIQGLRL